MFFSSFLTYNHLKLYVLFKSCYRLKPFGFLFLLKTLHSHHRKLCIPICLLSLVIFFINILF